MSESDEELLAQWEYLDTEEYRDCLKRARSNHQLGLLQGKSETLLDYMKIAVEGLRNDAERAREHEAKAAAAGSAMREDSDPEPVQWSERKHRQLVRAPYRFAALNERVATAESQPDLDRPLLDGLCATLTVDWRIETPILIAAGKADGKVDQPFALAGDRGWALPGASLRGAMRAALEAVAHGRLFQTNRHYRFALRDFEHEHYKGFVKQSGTGDGDLKAGWLMRHRDGYGIRPCARWGRVEIASLRPVMSSLVEWAKLDRPGKYRRADRKLDEVYEPDWPEKAFQEPRPFASEGDGIYRPLSRDSGGDRMGFLVFSGAATSADSKDYEYVFFDNEEPETDPASSVVALEPETWEAFEIVNSKQGRKSREAEGAWAEFGGKVAEGQRIPVFYFGDLEQQGPDFSFGLTRLYRLPHKHSIGDVIPPGHGLELETGPDGALRADFVEALFGYVYEPDDLLEGHSERRDVTAKARKGRIAFGFATPVDPQRFALWPPVSEAPLQTVQGAPKPQYAPFYLVGERKDWSDDNARLAGRKFYPPKDIGADFEGLRNLLQRRVDDVRAASKDKRKDLSDVDSHFRFLAPDGDARFRSEIRLHNVSKAELGAILWVLTFGGDASLRHSLGRGRPFGAGRTAVARIEARMRHNGEPSRPETVVWTIDGEGAENQKALTPFFAAFEAAMDKALGSDGSWRASAPVRSFLTIARPRSWTLPDLDYLPFGPIEGTEFQRMGEGFQVLRAATGLRAKDAPRRLLAADR